MPLVQYYCICREGGGGEVNEKHCPCADCINHHRDGAGLCFCLPLGLPEHDCLVIHVLQLHLAQLS